MRHATFQSISASFWLRKKKYRIEYFLIIYLTDKNRPVLVRFFLIPFPTLLILNLKNKLIKPHRINLINTGGDAKQEALSHGEYPEEYEVHGSLTPYVAAASHHDQTHEYHRERDPAADKGLNNK